MNIAEQADGLHHHQRLREAALGAAFAAFVVVLVATWFGS